MTKNELSVVEFLDYVTAHSKSERPLFAVADITRLGQLAGSSPKISDAEAHHGGHFKLMKYTDIKDILDGIWAKRIKAEQEMLKEAA